MPAFVKIASALLLPLAFLTAPALADTCQDPQTTLAMRICAAEDYERADADLNAAYKQARAAMKRLDRDLPTDLQGGAEALLKAQRAWITFRDAACEAEGFLFRGGTFEPVTVLHCKAELTRQRSSQLQYLADGL